MRNGKNIMMGLPCDCPPPAAPAPGPPPGSAATPGVPALGGTGWRERREERLLERIVSHSFVFLPAARCPRETSDPPRPTCPRGRRAPPRNPKWASRGAGISPKRRERQLGPPNADAFGRRPRTRPTRGGRPARKLGTPGDHVNIVRVGSGCPVRPARPPGSRAHDPRGNRLLGRPQRSARPARSPFKGESGVKHSSARGRAQRVGPEALELRVMHEETAPLNGIEHPLAHVAHQVVDRRVHRRDGWTNSTPRPSPSRPDIERVRASPSRPTPNASLLHDPTSTRSPQSRPNVETRRFSTFTTRHRAGRVSTFTTRHRTGRQGDPRSGVKRVAAVASHEDLSFLIERGRTPVRAQLHGGATRAQVRS